MLNAAGSYRVYASILWCTGRLKVGFSVSGIFHELGLVARIDPTGRVYLDPNPELMYGLFFEFGLRPQYNFIYDKIRFLDCFLYCNLTDLLGGILSRENEV